MWQTTWFLVTYLELVSNRYHFTNKVTCYLLLWKFISDKLYETQGCYLYSTWCCTTKHLTIYLFRISWNTVLSLSYLCGVFSTYLELTSSLALKYTACYCGDFWAFYYHFNYKPTLILLTLLISFGVPMTFGIHCTFL